MMNVIAFNFVQFTLCPESSIFILKCFAAFLKSRNLEYSKGTTVYGFEERLRAVLIIFAQSWGA